MHEFIKVDFVTIAKKMLTSGFTFSIKEDKVTIIGCPTRQDTETIVEDYLASITPEGHIIMEGALKQLYEDLDYFILLLAMSKILNFLELFRDKNDSLKTASIKEYWTEMDG